MTNEEYLSALSAGRVSTAGETTCCWFMRKHSWLGNHLYGVGLGVVFIGWFVGIPMLLTQACQAVFRSQTSGNSVLVGIVLFSLAYTVYRWMYWIGRQYVLFETRKNSELRHAAIEEGVLTIRPERFNV